MSGGLIALILASITGMLAAWLWIGQTSQVNSTADAARAEQRCEQARFDQRFNSTLSSPDPARAASDAERVDRLCNEAERLRAEQRAAAAEQAAQMKQLQQSLANSLSPAASASQPTKEQK
jgi:uncharacterized membrane protein YccC